MNTFRIIGKSPARSTDRKNVVYVTNIRNGYGVWNRVVTATVAEVISDTEDKINAQPNRQEFRANPDAITDALTSLSDMMGYNAPDNY